MFVEPILKRVEAKIQSTVSHASGTAIAVVPFLVAVGFATAAADSYLIERYDVRTAYLILGAAYLVIAAIVYVLARERERQKARVVEAELADAPIINPVKAAMDQFSLPSIEQTLMSFAGKTSAPAAKAVADQAMKNAHLIIGAGIGGLVAALLLSARGFEVTVLERAATPGGKIREIDVGGARDVSIGRTLSKPLLLGFAVTVCDVLVAGLFLLLSSTMARGAVRQRLRAK